MYEARRELDGVGEVIEQSPARPLARLLLAHGAGAPMDSDFMNRVCTELCARDIACVRFEFPYMVRRRELQKILPPNPMPVLLETWQTLVHHYREQGLPLFIGGKSMGGRMATLWAAQSGSGCAGLVCFGYPFHPARRPERLRTVHLPDLPVPTLVVQGTRDALGNQEEVAGYALGGQLRVHWIAGGDHDLKPLKKTGVTHEQALAHAAQAAVEFIKGIVTTDQNTE